MTGLIIIVSFVLCIGLVLAVAAVLDELSGTRT